VTRLELTRNILRKRSYLCTGLDTDLNRLPVGLDRDMRGLVNFNMDIISATADCSVAYKINTAFYEQHGARGWEVMEETLDLVPGDCLAIADAKRGDIGNTSSMYAKAFFDELRFDAITVSPYMGEDSLRPFLEFEDKWVICLALTSNAGSSDFQLLESAGKRLYEHVIETVCRWGNPDNLMFVTGATQADSLAQIRTIIPEHFLLVPGVGAQGGDLYAVSDAALNDQGGLLVNASRSILYASNDEDYREAARAEALRLQTEMAICLRQAGM
jgi:orotidine-5'-phosphate decarboxylase